MKFKSILKSFISLILVLFVLVIFAGCKKDELSNLFADGELGDFWDLKQDDAEIVDPPKSGDEDEIVDEEVFNMDAVKRLAYRDISPFDFMKKFPGTLEGTDPVVYLAGLPNDYWVRIEYSGDTINSMFLQDHRINQSIDLQTQQIEIDEFLLERGE